ncbi:hypothetical protein KAK07_23695 [Ideonella sp. 4Y16]|uniref:CoF synthetase n=1 Tax=Ideonella alba TaxID=2824118 RepID=A0A940Y9G0_9BURK|nr:hypothetical protein [Ideonella alba]MBQ0930625.1 hypothetical protein [Ideonella alba]MBQ0946362.1 hypothetical protein [Ideonella alba]
MSDALLEMAKVAMAHLRDPSMDVTSIAPRLASYFALAGRMRQAVPELGIQLHHRMVHEALQWATRSSPFYRRSLPGLSNSGSLVPIEEFESIPIMNRDDISRHIDEIRTPTANFAFATFTSGTTSGEPLIIERCEEEQRYLHEFVSTMSPPRQRADKRFALRLVTPWHGRVLEFPSQYHFIPVSVTTLSGLKTAAKLLMRTYVHDSRENRISGIGGGLISVRRLTAYLEQSVDAAVLPRLLTLQSTSEYVTAHARRQIERFWGVDLIDRFGLSEAIVGAWRCLHCRRYHLEPYGYAEVISFETGRPIADGVGRLVITGYYPFMQAVPFVRYATGDAVRLFASACPTGRPGMELLGRIDRSVLAGVAWVIGEYEIYDILDEHPALQRTPVYSQFPVGLQEAGAFPVYRYERVGETHTLYTQLRDGDELDNDRLGQLAHGIKQTLTARTGADWRVIIAGRSTGDASA